VDEFTKIKYSETKQGKLYFMIGLPRAGKTTFMNNWKAEDPKRVVVCFDNIRLAMYDKDHIQNMEPFLWELAQIMIKTLLLSGHDVMADDTHSSQWKRDYYKKMNGEGIYINTPLDICLSRAPQEHREFLDAIKRMAKNLESFEPEQESVRVVDWNTLQNSKKD